MNRCIFHVLVVTGAFLSQSMAQTLPPEFPKGIKRTWHSFGGKQQEFVIIDVLRDQSVTVAPDLASSQRGSSSWNSLHPVDRAWLQNAFLWRDQQNAGAGNASANIVPFPANPDRTLIGGPAISEFYGSAAASPKYLVALYLWWWHELGYLQIDRRKGEEDQLEFLMEKVDDAFKREDSLNFNQSAGFEKALRDFFAEVYPDTGGFSFYESVNLSPESLHHHTRSGDLTLMGVREFTRGQKYADFIAVIDVSENGRIEFIHDGNRIIGQMNPVTPAHPSYRDFSRSGWGWSNDPATWEIKILNEPMLPLDYQKGETQFFVDAMNRLSLWIVRPCKYTAKQFVGTPAPPVPAMPVALPDPRETPKSEIKQPVARDPQFFITRRRTFYREVSSPPLAPASRTWTDLSGRTIDARFAAFDRAVDGSLIAKVATTGGPASLTVSQLSSVDVAYLTFLSFDRKLNQAPPLRSGTLSYRIESAKAGSFEIKIHYGNLQCQVVVRPIKDSNTKDEGLLDKARNLVLGDDEYRLEIDYPLFTYRTTSTAAPTPMKPEDLVVNLPGNLFGKPAPDDIVTWVFRANPAEHGGLPCRLMLDLEKRGLAGPGFTGAGKMAVFSTEESMYVWKILCNDPGVPASALLQSMKPFADKWYEAGVIPMDVRMTHLLDPQASVRLQLTGYDFSVAPPELSLK